MSAFSSLYARSLYWVAMVRQIFSPKIWYENISQFIYLREINYSYLVVILLTNRNSIKIYIK